MSIQHAKEKSVFTRTLLIILYLSSGYVFAANRENGQIIADMDCYSLYQQASQLEPTAQMYRSPLINQDTHTLVAVIGTVVEPVHYYFGLYVPWNMKQRYSAHKNRAQLDSVRSAMAAKQCFIK